MISRIRIGIETMPNHNAAIFTALTVKYLRIEKESSVLYTNAKKLEFLCFLSSPFPNHGLKHGYPWLKVIVLIFNYETVSNLHLTLAIWLDTIEEGRAASKSPH